MESKSLDEAAKEAIENALYATGRFTIRSCETITEGVMDYLKDAGFEWQQNQHKQEDEDLNARLQEGRHYLMGVDPENLTVEDALEAFGFSRNGLRI